MKQGIIVALAFALSCSVLMAQEMKKEAVQKPQFLVGYLVDKMCGKRMVMDDVKKSDAKAAKHTRECALDEACAANGYGLVSGGKFYTFDEQGDRKAKEYLNTMKKKDNILVEVKGIFDGGSIKVETIKDLSQKKLLKRT